MGIADYLKETRGELHHVAWPTRTQTIVYTLIVVAISVFIALYLGFFDFLFTSLLSKSLQFIPTSSAQVEPISVTTSTSPGAPIKVTPASQQSQESGVPSFK